MTKRNIFKSIFAGLFAAKAVKGDAVVGQTFLRRRKVDDLHALLTEAFAAGFYKGDND